MGSGVVEEWEEVSEVEVDGLGYSHYSDSVGGSEEGDAGECRERKCEYESKGGSRGVRKKDCTR